MKNLLVLLTLITLTACGGGGSTTSNPTPVASSPPTISVANASIEEGDGGTTQLVFTVSLSKSWTSTLTVDYATSDGTATSDDYISTNGTLTFNSGTTSQTFSVDVIGDILYADEDGDETFNVTLSNGSTDTATGTIINDDITRKEAYDALGVLVEEKLEEYQVAFNIPDPDPNKPIGWLDPRNADIDLDGDGDQDVVITANGINDWNTSFMNLQALTIFRNNLGKGFAREDTNIAAHGRDLQVADYNGDGLEDIFMAAHGFDYEPYPGAQDWYILQTSDGGLVDASDDKLLVNNGFSHGSCQGDFDNNGFADIIIASGGTIRRYNNDGDAMVEEPFMENFAELFGGSNVGAWWCNTMDIDKDGDIDVILGAHSPDATDRSGNDISYSHYVIVNDGTGKLTYDFNKIINGYKGINENLNTNRFGNFDVNNDGCMDFYTLETNYVSAWAHGIFINDCLGNFTQTHYNNTNGNYGDMLLLDIDNDGTDEIVFVGVRQDGNLLTVRKMELDTFVIETTDATPYNATPSQFIRIIKHY